MFKSGDIAGLEEVGGAWSVACKEVRFRLPPFESQEVQGPVELGDEVSGGAGGCAPGGRGKGGGPGIPVQHPGIGPGGGPGCCRENACLMTVSAGVSPVGVAGKVGNPSGPHLLNLVC